MRSMSLLLFVRLMSAMGSTADPQLSLKFKLANGSFRPIAGIQFFNLLGGFYVGVLIFFELKDATCFFRTIVLYSSFEILLVT